MDNIVINQKGKYNISKKRDLQFDVARSLAVLYVVGYYHLVPGYMDAASNQMLTGEYTYSMIFTVLGLFMFISGYFLSNYRFEKYLDVKEFYLKRLKRFYPLYFIALFSMFIGGWFSSIKVLFTSAVGLSSIITPQPGTLWFFSMLCLFYILTPLLMMSPKSPHISSLAILIFWVGGIFLAFLLIDFVLDINIDKKIYWCFACYSLGLLAGRYITIKNMTNSYYWGICYLLLFCLTINHIDNQVLFMINIFSGVFLFLTFSFLLSKIRSSLFLRVISFISYSSMCAYLFHRHVYKLGRLICEDGIIPSWYGFIVLLPVVFIVSYLIQKGYDKVVVKVKALKDGKK